MGSLLLSRPATVPRQAQRPDTLCNQQVRCSSHPTSSKTHRKLRFLVLFCCKNAENGASQNVGQLPDPHRDPQAEMRGKYERASERKLLPFRCSACPVGLIESAP